MKGHNILVLIFIGLTAGAYIWGTFFPSDIDSDIVEYIGNDFTVVDGYLTETYSSNYRGVRPAKVKYVLDGKTFHVESTKKIPCEISELSRSDIEKLRKTSIPVVVSNKNNAVGYPLVFANDYKAFDIPITENFIGSVSCERNLIKI